MLIRVFAGLITFALIPRHVAQTTASVVVDPTSPVTGSTPTKLTFDMTIAGGLVADDDHTIKIEAKCSPTTDCSIFTNSPTDLLGLGVTQVKISDGGGLDITSDFEAGKVPNANEVEWKYTGSQENDDQRIIIEFTNDVNNRLAVAGPAGQEVTFIITAGAEAPTSALTGWTVADVAVAGDPLTFWNGEKIKFWFPIQTLLPLLETPDMRMLASVFEGPSEDYQWFERFVFTLPDGDVFADIRVKRQLPGDNVTAARRGFRQLEIRLGNENKPLLTLPNPSLYYTVPGTRVRIAVEARPFNLPRQHGSTLMEYVHIESESLSFLVHTSHAGTDFPNDIHMQTKYTHLDWTGLDMRGLSSFTGILPQLWGITPMTQAVAAMRTAPSKRSSPRQLSLMESTVTASTTVCSEDSQRRVFQD